MEHCDGHLVEAGEDKLTDHQKSFYKLKLDEFTEFWASLRAHNSNIGLHNQEPSDGSTVAKSSFQNDQSLMILVNDSLANHKSPSPGSNNPPTLPSIYLNTSTSRVFILEQNAPPTGDNGMQTKVTQSPSEVSPLMAASAAANTRQPTLNLFTQYPTIRLKPQTETSTLFNAKHNQPAPPGLGGTSKEKPRLENKLCTSIVLKTDDVGRFTCLEKSMPQPQLPTMPAQPGTTASGLSLFPQSQEPNEQYLSNKRHSLSLNDDNMKLLSSLNTGRQQGSDISISSPLHFELSPSISSLPVIPNTREEVVKQKKTYVARKSTTTQRMLLPADSKGPIKLLDLTNGRPIPLNPQNGVRQYVNQNDRKKGPTTEKTFPSLVVSVCPSLKIFPKLVINNERFLMDTQLRKVTQMPPRIFIEYLLQKRVLRSEQLCKIHKKKLKLVIHSTPGKFPHSGGYEWIAECCTSDLCSIFTGSIFDQTNHVPMVIVKLMYHWACRTAVHNVLVWVKVDNYVLKTYYTYFRAICTASVHEKLPLLGGPQQKVQLGIINIGTTTQSRCNLQVTVDVLAVLDTKTQSVRLRAMGNSFAWSSNKAGVHTSKFVSILEVLKVWVHPQSMIITDLIVDASLCREYGFANFVLSGGKGAVNNNLAVLDYLRAKIPNMFQNTLSLLSFEIIQQFLDELVWREVWGPIPSRAYETLVSHVGEMTKLPGPDLILKLKKIASDPFKIWKYSVWSINEKPEKNSQEISSSAVERTKSVANKTREEPVKGTLNIAAVEGKKDLDNKMQKLPINKTKKEKVKKEGKELVKETQMGGVHNVRKEFMSETRAENVKTKEGLDIDARGGNPLEVALDPPQTVAKSPMREEPQTISLESYYYGYALGNPHLVKTTGPFLAECALCKRDLLTATAFTEHLIHHALNSLNDMSTIQSDHLLTICPRCFEPVRYLQTHILHKHPEPQPGTAKYCEICKLNLECNDKLFKHMSFRHCELDVPYECNVCHFRTSIYDDAVNHFKKSHDKDTCLQCPFCMRLIRFCSRNGREIKRNQTYFIQHIQKHINPDLNWKCEKCVLSFINTGALKDHQERCHRSAINVKGILRHLEMKQTTMPIPSNTPYPPVTLHESGLHTLNEKILSSSVKMDASFSKNTCAECDSSINPNHFSIKMNCNKCAFQSYCAYAIMEHSARVHPPQEPSKIRQMLGGIPLMEKDMYCSACAFHSNNSNRMATHLSRCHKAPEPLATTDKRKCHAYRTLPEQKKLKRSSSRSSQEDQHHNPNDVPRSAYNDTH